MIVEPDRQSPDEGLRLIAFVRHITRRRRAKRLQAAQDRKRAEAMQRHAIAELERLNRMKTDFVSVVSHEFRTALMSIQGFSELMRDLELTPAEVHEHAGRINTEARRLERLINHMLDLDRIESGSLALSHDRVDINQVVRDAVEGAAVLSRAHSFSLALDPAVGRVEGDRDRLIEVLANLLSNAVKYSPKAGRVEVSTKVRGHLVQVSVSDRGVGIPLAALEQVFERFSRVEQPGTNQLGGTGLGLAIVKEIVELHGGEVWAESQPGQGTTFHFTIPMPGSFSESAGAGNQARAADDQGGVSDGR